MRTTALVTVAVALATFAVATWDVSARLRDDQAAMTVGARTVYTVAAPSPGSLLATVRKLDPEGRSLAAAVRLPESGARPPVLAVDTTRLAAVAQWRPRWSGARLDDVAARLRPPVADSLTLRGSVLRLTLSGDPGPGYAEPALVGTVITADGRRRNVAFGPLRYGTQTVTATVPQCRNGCLLARLKMASRGDRAERLFGGLEFRSLSVDGRPVPRAFAEQGDWRAEVDPVALSDHTSAPRVEVFDEPTGVRLDFSLSPEHDPVLARADVPAALPVAVAGAPPLDLVGRDALVQVRDVSGGFREGTVEAHLAAAPRIGTTGLVADLENSMRLGEGVDSFASYEVWVAEDADPAAALPERLRAAGLLVVDRDDLVERTSALDRGGTALALLLLVGVAVAALVLSTSAVVLSALSTGRRRAFEVAALRTAGVPASALRKALDREYGGLVGVGAVFGLVAGAVTAALAGPAVAVLGLTGPRAPGHDSIAWPPVLLVAVISLVVYGAVSAACARLAVRMAGADVLRGAQA
jgi:hypothetical protein